MTSKELAKAAVHALEDKKGKDISVIDISNVSVIADYFVIATGSNMNQVQALVDSVEDELAKLGVESSSKEGNSSSTWVLLDFKDIIVHVFSEEDRIFYNLERIWRDGKQIDITQL
jgi:ribosome-associated protein